MNMDDLNKNKILLDGQIIYFIDETIINELRKDPIIDGICIGSDDIINIIEEKVIFSNCHIDFKCGLYKLQYPKKSSWVLGLFYMYQEHWYRVRIEYSKCKNCGKVWSIANPSEYSLFDFVKDKELVFNKVKCLARLSCPKCRGGLDRHAIWIDEK